MGLNVMLPFEQESNEIIRGDAKLVTMKYFFTRKLMFVKECDAVVCLPGGFGTLAGLAFRFNRRNHGRLRKLIDWINAEVG